MKTKMTRRSALAISAAAAGATMTAAQASAATKGPDVDPIFALIERHRAAMGEAERLLDLLDAADEAAELAADKALRAAQKALAAGIATTFGGVQALARYAIELREQENELFAAEECTSW
jgi:hypothetical protein